MRAQLAEVISKTLESLVAQRLLPGCGFQKPSSFSVSSPKTRSRRLRHERCHVAGKTRQEGPRAIAGMLNDGWMDPDGLIAASEVAGPGFINFTVRPRALLGVIHEVLQGAMATGGRKVQRQTRARGDSFRQTPQDRCIWGTHEAPSRGMPSPDFWKHLALT